VHTSQKKHKSPLERPTGLYFLGIFSLPIQKSQETKQVCAK